MKIIRIIKKFGYILPQEEKIREIGIFVMMIISGFLEMISVSAVIPFINAVMYPEEFMKKEIVVRLCGVCNINSDTLFFILFSILLAAAYIFKNVFLLLQMNIQYRFVYRNLFAAQKKLYECYLSKPYEFFVTAKSGEILRIIENDTSEAFTLIIHLLNFLAELSVSSILIVTIFAIAPWMTLCMAVVLFGMTAVIFRITKPVLKKSGIDRQNSCTSMNQWLLQSISGIKEIKIMRTQEYFKRNFESSVNIYVNSLRRYQVLTLVPRYMIEAVAMAAFFIIVAAMISYGSSLDRLIPVLSAVAMAAVRLLPSVNRISGSMADIAYREPMLDKLIENLKNVSKDEKNINMEKKNSVEIDIKKKDLYILNGVSYRYQGGEKDILNNAAMEIKKGQSAGITGVSGAGKTTVVDIMLGLLKPREGQVLADGKSIYSDMDGWLSQTGYIPQTIFILDGSIRENVAFGINSDEIDEDKVWNALKDAAIDEFVRNLPQGLDTWIGERGIRLSGGQRQRIGIARALYSNPSVLFFDEATSALDHETEKEVMDSINHLRGKKTMIIIAHRLSTIEQCDTVFCVENGKIKRER